MSGLNGDFTNPTSINDLKPKMKLRGTVKQIQLAGALIDVGVGQDGMLHISQIKKEPVHNVSDALSEGEEITVWVRRIDKGAGRIELTCIEPLALDWHEIKKGQVYTGKVTRVERFGAFVDLGAERPGLVHVSELSGDYVGNTEDVVTVGEEVQVKVINVDRRKRQIDLSIKALDMDLIEDEEDDEEEEELPTAMAMALKRAMEGGAEQKSQKSRRSKRADTRARKQKELEDVISRTLEQHREQN